MQVKFSAVSIGCQRLQHVTVCVAVRIQVETCWCCRDQGQEGECSSRSGTTARHINDKLFGSHGNTDSALASTLSSTYCTLSSECDKTRSPCTTEVDDCIPHADQYMPFRPTLFHQPHPHLIITHTCKLY